VHCQLLYQTKPFVGFGLSKWQGADSALSIWLWLVQHMAMHMCCFAMSDTAEHATENLWTQHMQP
jgi:hypothetical protein